MEINIKVKNKFEKEFVNGLLIKPFKDYPFLAEKIKLAMQQMYDLGHADGMADMFFSAREAIEKNR
jgi:hypothetical protein